MAQFISIINSITDQNYGPYANVKRIWDSYGSLMKEIDTTNVRTTPEKRKNNFQDIQEVLTEELNYLTTTPCKKPTECVSNIGDTAGFTKITLYEKIILKYFLGQKYRWIKYSTLMKHGFSPGEIKRLMHYGLLEDKLVKHQTFYKIPRGMVENITNYLKVKQ